jgi:hypothetical protein
LTRPKKRLFCTAPAEEQSSGGEVQNGTDADGVSISGLMGTIRRDQIENALNPRMTRFTRCFAQRMGDVEYLGGDIRMSFRVHTDGTVAWVYPADSDIGDRDTERCVIEVARSTRFPRPRGGEAEFSWGFGMDPPDDVRPPLRWEASALGERAEDVAALGAECGARGAYRVTAYVAPEGAVVAAGGTMPDAESETALECILERVRAMEMPDPGSYPAKITFEVP